MSDTLSANLSPTSIYINPYQVISPQQTTVARLEPPTIAQNPQPITTPNSGLHSLSEVFEKIYRQLCLKHKQIARLQLGFYIGVPFIDWSRSGFHEIKTVASQLEKMIKNVHAVDEYIDYFQYYQILFSLLNNRDF